jgi:hypothetical protein
VPVIDEAFLEALRAVRESFRELHPTLAWDGELRAQSIVTDAVEPGECTALLFSGGVDSLASYVHHRGEKPLLVSVWGADVGLHQRRRWQRVTAANLAFARDHGSNISFVTTNFRTFFNHHKLRARFLESFQNWYSGIQQGLGLVTLCAPLSHTYGVRRLLISSTHTADWNLPWGSHPSIENRVRWGATEVAHDGYPLSRQKKLQALAEYIRNHDRHLRLRVCWGRAANCSACTKCSLTMVGLLLEGLDPGEHGFRFDSATLARMRRRLEEGSMDFSQTATAIWIDIQRHIPQRKQILIEGLDKFFAWLEKLPIADRRKMNEDGVRFRMRQYLESRPEPVGRWLRRALRHPFP